MDGDHKGWLIVEVNNRDEARAILPPIYRSQAKVVQLNRFSMEELDRIIQGHQ
jgi:hypothetical protein